jgi:hypothetical protein
MLWLGACSVLNYKTTPTEEWCSAPSSRRRELSYDFIVWYLGGLRKRSRHLRLGLNGPGGGT